MGGQRCVSSVNLLPEACTSTGLIDGPALDAGKPNQTAWEPMHAALSSTMDERWEIK